MPRAGFIRSGNQHQSQRLHEMMFLEAAVKLCRLAEHLKTVHPSHTERLIYYQILREILQNRTACPLELFFRIEQHVF